MQELKYLPWVEENAYNEAIAPRVRKCDLLYNTRHTGTYHINLVALALHQNTKDKHNMQKQTNIIKPRYQLYLLAAPVSG